MAEMKRQLENYIKCEFQEGIQYRKEFGKLPSGIPDEAISVMAKWFAEYWDAGRSVGLNEAHKIVEEVIGKTIQDELKKHPKMSLRTFAKQYGYIKEEEK